MKVLIVTQYFWPETFRINEVADSLSVAVDSLTVLTAQPNYPHGRVFSGYKAYHVQTCFEKGYKILRVPFFPRGYKNPFKLALNYLSFVLSASTIGFFKLRKDSYDIIFCFGNSPIFQVIPGLVMSRYFMAKTVIYVQDLWPESVAATGYIKNKFVLKIIRKIVKIIYDRADLILISSKSFEKPIRAMTTKTPIKYFPNSFTSDQLPLSITNQVDLTLLKNHFSIVFTGNIGHAQSVSTIIKAAEKINHIEDIIIVMVGEGSCLDWMKLQQKEKNLRNIHFLGKLDLAMMPKVYEASNVLLATLADEEIFGYTVPQKIVGYLASGRPIVAAMNGEAARIIEENKAGLCAKAGDWQGLAANMIKLYECSLDELSAMGQRGKAYFLKAYSHSKLMTQLTDEFKALIGVSK